MIDEEGVETLLSELLKGVSDSQVCLLALLIKYIYLGMQVIKVLKLFVFRHQ